MIPAQRTSSDAALRAQADTYVATLLAGLIDNTEHDARAAQVCNTERSETDAVLLTAAAHRLREIRAGLNTGTESAR